LVRPEIRVTTDFKKSSLITGVGANFDALDRTFFDKKETFNSKYIFAQYDFHLVENMNLVVGARFDSHNKYKSTFSPKISSSYKVSDWLKAKASVGYGFKAPDFRQLFFNFNNSASGYIVLGIRTLHELYGNEPNVQAIEKDFRPENSIGTNVGFEVKSMPNLKVNINFFRDDINDLINTVALYGGLPNLNTGTTIFYYENRDRVLTQGVELDLNYKLSDNFTFVGGYQFLEAKDKQEIVNIETGTVFFRRTPYSLPEVLERSDYFGLPNRSRHVANAKLFYQILSHDFSANIRALYRRKYALFDTNSGQNIIDKYYDFVAGNVQINMAIDFFFQFNECSARR
jgi:outer membrane receptor for ferrienterochelin and colicins